MMLALRVYDGPEIVKEYATDTEFLTVGVCEDAFRLVDVDALLSEGDGSGGETARKVIKGVMNCYPLAKRLFPEITEAEFQQCRPAEVSGFLIGIVTYGLEQLAGGSTAKKAHRGKILCLWRTRFSKRKLRCQTGIFPSIPL